MNRSNWVSRARQMQEVSVCTEEKKMESKGDWMLLNQHAGDDACVPSFGHVAIAVADLGTQPQTLARWLRG